MCPGEIKVKISVSLIALAILSISFDYCRSLGHYEPSGLSIIIFIIWIPSYIFAVIEEIEKLLKKKEN